MPSKPCKNTDRCEARGLPYDASCAATHGEEADTTPCHNHERHKLPFFTPYAFLREMNLLDHHTHNPNAPTGRAIVCLPRNVVENPKTFTPQKDALYSVGVHPWWTDELCFNQSASLLQLWQGVQTLASHPQVIAIGETGLDRQRGNFLQQDKLFAAHIQLASKLHKPLIIHCVRAFDRLLFWRKKFATDADAPWFVHGFRGKPDLASQLTAAGIQLLFGPKANAQTLKLFRPDKLRLETDDSGLSIEEVAQAIEQLL